MKIILFFSERRVNVINRNYFLLYVYIIIIYYNVVLNFYSFFGIIMVK